MKGSGPGKLGGKALNKHIPSVVKSSVACDKQTQPFSTLNSVKKQGHLDAAPWNPPVEGNWATHFQREQDETHHTQGTKKHEP